MLPCLSIYRGDRVSNVIKFLEFVGASDSLRSTAAYEAAVAALEVEPSQRLALMDRDVASLTTLLDGRPAMFCMIIAPDDAKESEHPDHADDQTEGDEEKHDKE